MAEDNKQATPQGKVDMSKVALDMAKETGFFCGDEDRFHTWERNFIKKFYETIGLSDIPDEFLTFSKFIDAISGVLVKSVQNDIAIMNLTKRLAMFKLSENIQATADKQVAGTDDTPDPIASNCDKKPEDCDKKPEGGVLPTFVHPTQETK